MTARTMAAVVVFSVLLSGQTSGQDVFDIDDRAIQHAVERELQSDPAGPFPQVDVSSNDGVVTLDGVVPHLHASGRAVDIASDVRGVRAVVDRLTVDGAVRSDAAIAREVRAALEGSIPGVRSLEATVAGGQIVLRGTVSSWGEKRLATMLATRVRGATSVENDVTVEPAPASDDTSLQRSVEAALSWDRLLTGASLTATVDDGVVTLDGDVRSLRQREQAETVAWLSGARAVNGEAIDIASGGDGDTTVSSASGTGHTDDEIRRAVEAAVRRDVRVRPLQFEPTVTDAMVTLRGAVGTRQQARQVEQDARNTVGVRGVRNQLKIRPERPTGDLELEQEVRGALDRDPYVYPFDVDVDVMEAEAILRGTVDTVFERIRATAAASEVAGILHVDNRLEVRAPNRAYRRHQELEELYALEGEFDERPRAMRSLRRGDDEIRSAIREELWWSPIVDDEDITVAVEGGVATLTGRVDSWHTRDLAEDEAREGGAVTVVNRLAVTATDAPVGTTGAGEDEEGRSGDGAR